MLPSGWLLLSLEALDQTRTLLSEPDFPHARHIMSVAGCAAYSELRGKTDERPRAAWRWKASNPPSKNRDRTQKSKLTHADCWCLISYWLLKDLTGSMRVQCFVLPKEGDGSSVPKITQCNHGASYFWFRFDMIVTLTIFAVANYDVRCEGCMQLGIICLCDWFIACQI